jgi:competence protein ComEA
MVTSEGTSSNSSGSVQGSSTGSVNINQATEEELDALPGVGPVTAQKIISNRPYQSVDDLVSKKAVGQSVFSKIKDQVRVY